MIALPQPWPTNPWPTVFRTVRASEPTWLPGGMRLVTVQSPALGGRGDLALYEPAGAHRHEGPVALVVLLHGVYGSFWNWAFNGGAHHVLDDLVARGEVAPMVLAMPSDGLSGEGTAYLDRSDAEYERWIIDDVVTCAREAVDSIDERSPVYLAGNSMGGYGALRIAARFADRVTAVAAHSAITDLDELAQFTVDDIGRSAGLDGRDRRVVGDIADHRDEMPPIYLDCGTDDPLIDANRSVRDELEDLEVAHVYEEYEGAHNWDSWHRRIAHSLRFFDRITNDRLDEEP